jgi:murein DD-endopeptidase MepM/ murein hydrolase activator NlpD
VFPDGVAPTSATRTPATSTAATSTARRKARHAGPRRSRKTGRRQLTGLAAAIAAATSAVSLTGSAAPRTAPAAALTDAQASAITAARIDRRLMMNSRDANRLSLAATTGQARQATALKQATARAAKLAAYREQTLRRAKALAAAKAAAAAKARAQAASVRMMISGYHITATFNQGGSHWAHTHTGLDFAAPIGTRIGSVMAGEVISAEFAGAYGRRVEVRHDDGTVTWYCHMSEFTVSVGDRVAAGDQVGSVGVTGNTTGPHLHFEVHPDGGDPVDPYPWLQEHGLNP